MKTYTFKKFLYKIRQEWRKLTEDGYFEAEDLKKTAKDFSTGVLERDIINRIKLLKLINQRVIDKSKLEMNHHLEQHNLYKQIIENYEKIQTD
jgi:hypothetical protein